MLIYWDFHISIHLYLTLGFTERSKKVSSSSLGEKSLLMPEVRGEWTTFNWLKGESNSNNHFQGMEKSISEWTAHRSWARPHGGYSIRGCFLATIWPHITTWTLFKPTWVMLPDYVYPYMTTVYLILMTPSSRIDASYHKAQIISHWFVEHVSEFRTLSYWTESWWLSKRALLRWG